MYVYVVIVGDVLESGCVISCVLKTEIHGKLSQRFPLVSLPGGLKLTPWHPIKLQDKWTFPCDVNAAEVKEQPCDAVYSFLVEYPVTTIEKKQNRYASEMIISGIRCLTLAHGIKGDLVASHPFFGTEAVVRNMETLRGYSQGLICLA